MFPSSLALSLSGSPRLVRRHSVQIVNSLTFCLNSVPPLLRSGMFMLMLMCFRSLARWRALPLCSGSTVERADTDVRAYPRIILAFAVCSRRWIVHEITSHSFIGFGIVKRSAFRSVHRHTRSAPPQSRAHTPPPARSVRIIQGKFIRFVLQSLAHSMHSKIIHFYVFSVCCLHFFLARSARAPLALLKTLLPNRIRSVKRSARRGAASTRQRDALHSSAVVWWTDFAVKP